MTRAIVIAAILLFTLPARGIAQPADSLLARSIAFTFDDLPLASIHMDTRAMQDVTEDLLRILTQHDVPALGFVNEGKLYADSTLDTARVGVLRQWLDAGMELGNHTYSHPSLHNVHVAKFKNDLLRGEAVARTLVKARGGSYRFFRHPFLHTGRDSATRAEVEQFLLGHGYSVAPVTVDNSDWIFARAYETALDEGDTAGARLTGETYVSYMDSVFSFYEAQSTAILSCEIPQVLLLHANRINADWLSGVIDVLRRRGYAFITLSEALNDPAYRHPDRYFGPAGISWLHRWALTDGKRGAFFAGEPVVPEFIMKKAKVESQ